jgi:hypothetical protein
MSFASADIIARSAQVKTRTARRPTQYRELVAKDHDLRLARAIAATPHQEPEHGTEREVEKAQGPSRHPDQLHRSALRSRDPSNGTLQGVRAV